MDDRMNGTTTYLCHYVFFGLVIIALSSYHKATPKLAWFQDVESMLNHHLAGLLGLGSVSWVGH
jgi:photosystem I P700 chlorophyll a apoprotein A1